jgi:hypothetical protein
MSNYPFVIFKNIFCYFNIFKDIGAKKELLEMQILFKNFAIKLFHFCGKVE